MTIEKVLEYDVIEAMESLRQVLDNPALGNLIGHTEEMTLKEALGILDKAATELKAMDKNLKE
jgi:hypothetical protein